MPKTERMTVMSEISFKDGRREALQRLLPPSAGFAQNEEERDNYIRAFSAYLCEKDEAYYYNFAFLVQQNLEFQEFLKKAAAKRVILENFVDELKRSPYFSALAAQKPAVDPFVISINNFWEIEAASMECRLAKDFIVNGAFRSPAEDIIMLRCAGKQASVLSAIGFEKMEKIMKDMGSIKVEQVDSDE